mgnify:CR=1 FL=1
MSQGQEILRTPLRWFLKASASGALLCVPIAYGLYGAQPERILTFVLIGVIFSVVMWGGGTLAGAWIFRERPHLTPVRYALLAQVRWFLLYLVLFLTAFGLIRLILGINIARDLKDLVFSAMTGYLISSVILGFTLTASVAQKGRELEAARSRATLLALRAQLSPHTLFNGLNTVAALIPEEPRKAEAVVEGLSRLLRRILEALDREQWSLAEEFELLRDLLSLEQARFGDRLAVVLELAEGERDRTVPPLVLLPLVENSLKHGFRPKVGDCRLEVRAEAGRVVVRDDGVGRDPEASEGVGLRTVRQRVEAGGGRLRWLDGAPGTALEVAW